MGELKALNELMSQTGSISQIGSALQGRSSIPEDSVKRLFDRLYENLVFATPEERNEAVKLICSVFKLGGYRNAY